MWLKILASLVFVGLFTLPRAGRAEPLEAGLFVTPTTLADNAYKAFSENSLTAGRLGLDARFGVATLGGFELLPLVGYRFAISRGNLYLDAVENTLRTHDLYAGLRVRRELLSWLAGFAEVQGGALLANLESKSGVDKRTDFAPTWSVGGLAGFETHLSKTWLESRGVRRFNFGGELGAGYVRRGELTFDPKLETKDDALPTTTAGAWGAVNPSGWLIQIGVVLRFFDPLRPRPRRSLLEVFIVC